MPCSERLLDGGDVRRRPHLMHALSAASQCFRSRHGARADLPRSVRRVAVQRDPRFARGAGILLGDRMRRLAMLFALLAAVTLAGAAIGAPASVPPSGPEGALDRYVSLPDASYSWREVSSGRSGRTEFVEAILTSQTWHGITWKHQLFIIKPARIDAAQRAALLYIDGGS